MQLKATSIDYLLLSAGQESGRGLAGGSGWVGLWGGFCRCSGGHSDLEGRVPSRLSHAVDGPPSFLPGCWLEASVPRHVELSRQRLTTRQPASLRGSRQSEKREQARSPSASCDLAAVTQNHFTVCCSSQARHQAQPQAEGGKLSSTSSRKEIKESVVVCVKSEQLLFQKADDEQR